MGRCRAAFNRVYTARRLLAAGLVVYCAALPWQRITAETDTAADSRETYSPAAPQWLQAVGKLLIPGSSYSDGIRTYLVENCSATLVTSKPDRGADTIITAWHCLENYRDLSKQIIFTLPASASGSLDREVYRLADGGGMHADWAVLRLRQPIPPGEVTALLLHSGRADPDQAISMAGYSRDEGKGEGGDRLTFDPVCRITAQGPVISDSDCLAHKGASGGAVVQLSAAGTAQFSGVVSEGNGTGLSTFVPIAVFRSTVNRHLQ